VTKILPIYYLFGLPFEQTNSRANTACSCWNLPEFTPISYRATKMERKEERKQKIYKKYRKDSMPP
jgi:hypothetical protein